MPNAGNLLDYGIAINFFGNYRQEASGINSITDKLSSSLLSLQRLIIGGGITAGLYKFGNALLTTAKTMEQNFANLQSTLGSASKAIETLEWARKKGASTPFEIQEVNNAVGMMTTLGFNKNDKMREEVFNAVGDFAGLKGWDFGDMMQRVAKASFGNWESLGDQFGIRKQTIGGMAREQMSRTPEKFKGEEASIQKAIQMVEKGKQGTEEYRMAIVKLIGVLGRGGMENRLNTIAGAWSNVNDIFSNFIMKMVGYSQIQGTLANTVKDTIVNKILKPFMDAHTVVINGIKEQTTSVDQLGRIGKGVGDMLIQVWGMFDTQIGNATTSIVKWIDKLDAWFRDWQNNVAPAILFLALVRLQVEDFLRGFYEGFSSTFKWFIGAGLWVWKTLAKITEWLGITDGSAESLGKTLGTILGVMLGIRAFKFITNPLLPLRDVATTVLVQMDKLIFKQRIFNGLQRMADGNVRSGWTLITGGISRFTTALGPAIASSWAFTASLLANPITWIVIAVIALVGWLAYLIYNWDEVGKKMQGVSDIALTLLAIFAPIIGIPLIMAKYWDQFKNIFQNIWRGITGYLHGVWIWIRAKIIYPIRDTFAMAWDFIKTKAKQFVDWAMEKFPFLKTIFEGIRDVWKQVSEFIGKIWQKITDSNFIQGLLKIGEKMSSWFGDAGQNFEKDMVDKYGTPEEKAQMYQTVAKAGVTPKVENKTTNHNVTVPQVTIVQQPGQNGQQLGSDFMKGIKNNMGKMGK